MTHAPVVVEDTTDEDDTEDDDHDDEDSQDGGTPTEPEDAQSEDSYESDEDSFVEPPPQTRLRLREILFYDDKVGIFKARHARL